VIALEGGTWKLVQGKQRVTNARVYLLGRGGKGVKQTGIGKLEKTQPREEVREQTERREDVPRKGMPYKQLLKVRQKTWRRRLVFGLAGAKKRGGGTCVSDLNRWGVV